MDIRLISALAGLSALLTLAVAPPMRGSGGATAIVMPSLAIASSDPILPAQLVAVSPPFSLARTADLRDPEQPRFPVPGPALADDVEPSQPVNRLWRTWLVDHLPVRFSPLISDAAARTGLPYDFLFRLLRQESGLRADAVSPRGALGIAQFMPATALERGLIDPFDPGQAVIKAAELLRDHWVRFGNLGLAAAAYNAGPGRVERWLAGVSGMPPETRDYVTIVTGRAIEGWASAGRPDPRHSSVENKLAQASLVGAAPDVRDAVAADRPAAWPMSRRLVAERRPATRAGDRGSDVRRLEVVARSEDELCALVGGQSKTCTVRRTY